MTTPSSQRRKNRNLPVVVGLIGMFVVIVLITVVCILFLRLRYADRNIQPRVVATEQPSALPTISAPTATPGPPAPRKIVYTAEEPIKGYSNCTAFGFKGMITAGNGNSLQGVQIVVWDAETGLLALNNADAEGNYSIEIQEPPARRALWVQVYEDDVPVSQPVFLETQNDCESGFQIYQINWREVSSQ